MEDWEARIHAVVGEDSDRCDETALRYLTYLKSVLKFPIRVTGREDFPWEEAYVFGGWSKKEYAKLKNTNPSYTDIFELLDIGPPEDHSDLTATIRRVSDKRKFKIGLYWLATESEVSPEFQILDDYATWHANY